MKNDFEIQKNKIQLYSRQVFITDEVKDVVPDFLMMLHGVLDSPDIPLNVSRSYLQSDANVKKISQHITKKVADKLQDLFKKDRSDFEKKWDDINIFVKYGIISDARVPIPAPAGYPSSSFFRPSRLVSGRLPSSLASVTSFFESRARSRTTNGMRAKISATGTRRTRVIASRNSRSE